jgi:hypothetical protein
MRWPLFILSLILMGLWFPVSLFRKDERWFFADNFGLNSKRGIEDGDSVEEAWAALDAKFSLHNLKNISHEWAKESPKRAVKFLAFLLIVALFI